MKRVIHFVVICSQPRYIYLSIHLQIYSFIYRWLTPTWTHSAPIHRSIYLPIYKSIHLSLDRLTDALAGEPNG